jgi:hypothetical protein
MALSLEQPKWGQHRVANELAKQGVAISGGGMRGVWVRHDLVTMDKEAHGEFESECPGYCGAHDTFYVGTLKGCRADLSANLHRHVCESRVWEALYGQDAHHRGGLAQ